MRRVLAPPQEDVRTDREGVSVYRGGRIGPIIGMHADPAEVVAEALLHVLL